MPARAQPLVLVTGFEPFPGAPVNPTEQLIGALIASGWSPAGVHVSAHVLPTRFDVFESRLRPLLSELRPDAIVSFGLSAKAKGFTLERTARNALTTERPDAAGKMRSAPLIDPAGADTRASTLPLSAIAHRLGAVGLPWAWSDDAGDYLCNLVFYRTLAAHAAKAVPSGFVHVPYTRAHHAALRLGAEFSCLDESDLIAGAKIVIETVAEEL